MKTTATYDYAFLEHNEGKTRQTSDMNEGGNSSGYVVPSEFNEKYLKTLEKENVFRRLATTIDSQPAKEPLMLLLP